MHAAAAAAPSPPAPAHLQLCAAAAAGCAASAAAVWQLRDGEQLDARLQQEWHQQLQVAPPEVQPGKLDRRVSKHALRVIHAAVNEAWWCAQARQSAHAALRPMHPDHLYCMPAVVACLLPLPVCCAVAVALSRAGFRGMRGRAARSSAAGSELAVKARMCVVVRWRACNW